MIASGTTEAVTHGMDAQPMHVMRVETTAQSTSTSGSIATRIPQGLLRNVATPLVHSMAAICMNTVTMLLTSIGMIAIGRILAVKITMDAQLTIVIVKAALTKEAS
jgi:hypothetical protein